MRKVAVTLWALPMVTTQVFVPVHPVQPTKTLPGGAVAVSVTCVPRKDALEHVCSAAPVSSQDPPRGARATRPAAPSVPTRRRVRTCGPRNVACTAVAWVMVTSHNTFPVQAPVQPTNTESGEAVASSLTTVPRGNRLVHVCEAPGVFAHVDVGGTF